MPRTAWALALFLVFASALVSAPALRAHDLWIEPSSFRPVESQLFAVRLRVGEAFRGEAVPRDEKRIERFVAVGPGGEIFLNGTDGTDPAGFAVLPTPGTWVLIYDNRPATLELEGPKFEAYLAEEGLERISELRAQRGQTAAPGREIYSRCAKALVTVGAGSADGFDRTVGLPLELIPEASPSVLPATPADTAELPVKLLFRGKPLAGALVVAVPRDKPDARVSGRTGADGRVRLRLDHAGDWLVKTVHMEPAPTDSAANSGGADWESFWASLTFRR